MDEEKTFLSTILQEINHEFALQLDISPKVDRQLHTPEVSCSCSCTIIVGGWEPCQQAGYHDRIHLPLGGGSDYIGGWKLIEKSGEDLAYDIENVKDETDPANTTIILLYTCSITACS